MYLCLYEIHSSCPFCLLPILAPVSHPHLVASNIAWQHGLKSSLLFLHQHFLSALHLAPCYIVLILLTLDWLQVIQKALSLTFRGDNRPIEGEKIGSGLFHNLGMWELRIQLGLYWGGNLLQCSIDWCPRVTDPWYKTRRRKSKVRRFVSACVHCCYVVVFSLTETQRARCQHLNPDKTV